jgi:hypothetical protein
MPDEQTPMSTQLFNIGTTLGTGQDGPAFVVPSVPLVVLHAVFLVIRVGAVVVARSDGYCRRSLMA